MQWTAQQRQVLTDGWRAGLSSTEIARRIGGEVNRNAVARQRMRLGLPSRRGPLQELAQRVNGSRSGTGLRAIPNGGDGTPRAVARAARMGPLPGSNPRPWVLRLYGECCFPVAGEHADTLSCCEPVAAPAGLYCWRHKRILQAEGNAD